MSMGLALARYGIASLILDEDDKVCNGSRSVLIQRHTLEIFDRLGAVEPMMAKGVTWRVGRTFFREQELYKITLPGSPDEKFPPFINHQQYYTEEYLLKALEQQPLCELGWRHKVVGLSQTGDTITVMAETPQGQKLFEASYVTAADGSHSPVRHLLQIPFEGKAYPNKFLIVDIKAELASGSILPLTPENPP